MESPVTPQKSIDQLELTEANVEEYIKDNIDEFPFSEMKEIEVEEIPTGFCNVNWVFKLKLTSGQSKDWKIFLKQARPYVKAKKDVSFFAERIYYEYKAIQILEGIWGQGVVPDVLSYDKENYVLAMNDLKRGGEVLAEELKEGIVRPSIGPVLGRRLGKLHGETFQEDVVLRGRKKDQEMLEFSYEFRTEGAKKEIDEKVVGEVVKECKQAPRSFTITDIASKNIFVEEGEVRFFDFENAMMNDPAWDLGFILGHFFLELGHRTGLEAKVQKLVESCIENYKKEVLKGKINQEVLAGIESRAAKVIGLTLLHRVSGGVGEGKGVYVSYIQKEKLSEIKKLAKGAVQGEFFSPKQII